MQPTTTLLDFEHIISIEVDSIFPGSYILRAFLSW